MASATVMGSATATGSATTATVDGRRLRRERGRAAVTDAVLELVLAGELSPTAEAIAERAGVSVTSVFRYFDTLDDLRRATTELYLERFPQALDLPGVGEGTLDERIASFVASRLSGYQANEPMARFIRARAPEHGAAAELLRRVRATRADQVRHHFDAELRAMTPATSASLVAVIATLTSFESWDQLRADHGRTPRQITRAWTDALQRLLR